MPLTRNSLPSCNPHSVGSHCLTCKPDARLLLRRDLESIGCSSKISVFDGDDAKPHFAFESVDNLRGFGLSAASPDGSTTGLRIPATQDHGTGQISNENKLARSDVK